MTTIAIHQPNFAPWFGYFHKMATCDLFVLLDDVEFSKNSYTNRARVAGNRWLTIPVSRRNNTLIADVTIADSSFPNRHRGQLQAEYPQSPQLEELIAIETNHATGRLIDLNVAILTRLRQVLGITTPWVYSSALGVSGSATERLVNIVEALGGHTYLSGAGGFGYQDVELFAEHGIGVARTDFDHPTYRQTSAQSVSGLSVLDAWLLHGEYAAQLLSGSSD